MIYVFLPVRGGSKSIPMKNIKVLGNKPLVQWTIDASLCVECVDKIVVSTDSEEIRKVVINLNGDMVDVIGRSSETASDTATSESALLEFVSTIDEKDIVVFIQATSPLMDPNDIKKGINACCDDGYDSSISVVRQKRFLWDEGGNPQYDILNRPRRQEYDGLLVENGAFYISKAKNILDSQCRVSGNIKVIECSEDSYFEIDEPIDFEVIESIIDKKKDIKMLVCDVDGTLTDGTVSYDNHGNIQKVFNVKDGMGFELLRKCDKNIITSWVTSSKEECIIKRAQWLKIDEIIMGSKNKVEAVIGLCRKYNLSFSNIAYVGDDINDLEVMKRCGMSFCPSDATEELKEFATVLNNKGGRGAVREVIDILICNTFNYF